MDCKGALVALLLVLAVASALPRRSSTSLRGSDILWPPRHVKRTVPAPTSSEDDSSSSSSSEEDTPDHNIDLGDLYLPYKPTGTDDIPALPKRQNDEEWGGLIDPGFAIIRPPPPKYTKPDFNLPPRPMIDPGYYGHIKVIDPGFTRPLPRPPTFIDPGFESPGYPEINDPGFVPAGPRYPQMIDPEMTIQEYPIIDPDYVTPSLPLKNDQGMLVPQARRAWLPISPYRKRLYGVKPW